MNIKIEPKRQETYLGYVRQAKIQISLRIRAVWSEYSLSALWMAKNAKFLHADIISSGQTLRMRRLIWVFDWRTCKEVRFLTLRFDCNQNITNAYES